MGKNDEQYEVEAIIGKRRKKNSGKVEYRVWWKGYSKEQATWEPEENLDMVQQMLDEFNEKIDKKRSTMKSTVVPQKKTQDVPSSRNDAKKVLSQKMPQKANKGSDQDFNGDQDEEDNEVTKATIVPPSRGGRSNRIQEEAPSKPVEKKNIAPTRNGISKTMNGVHDTKQPAQLDKSQKIQTSNEGGFSEDEDEQVALEVIGIVVSENGSFAFSVYEKKFNRKTIMRRREIIKKDPVALIRFYEKKVVID